MLGAARLRVLDTGQYSLAVRVLQPEKLGDGPVFQGGPIGVWRLFLRGESIHLKKPLQPSQVRAWK